MLRVMVCFGVLWCGVVWFVFAWHGLVWSGVSCHDVPFAAAVEVQLWVSKSGPDHGTTLRLFFARSTKVRNVLSRKGYRSGAVLDVCRSAPLTLVKKGS